MIISKTEMDSIIDGRCHNPHQWLGIHRLSSQNGLVIRAWDPFACKIYLKNLKNGKSYQMECLSNKGFFELFLPRNKHPFPYSFHSIYNDGEKVWEDPYSFLPSIENFQLAEFNQGSDRRPFREIGFYSPHS